MVGKVEFESTQPNGMRFTVSRASPTAPLTQKMAPRAGHDPATVRLTIACSTN